MSFLFPAFLIGCLAVIVPIVLHLLRRERLPRVPFSDIRFLQAARVEQARRRRLRELLLLALRVAALLLLAFAFARPFLSDAAAPDRPATVVLVDTSFSLSAPGQPERVRAEALAAVAAVPGVIPLLNVLYAYVARKRDDWFGRHDACALPDASFRARFLE